MEYRPLDHESSEIRVLKLNPKSRGKQLLDKISGKIYGDRAVLIDCSLIYTTLKDTLSYDALSYCWGSESDGKCILVDGRQLTITRNLYFCLQELQKKQSSRAIWVDAVCINQADHEEKKHQIPMMGEIYKRASSVITWLGPASPAMHLAMDTISLLGNTNRVHLLPTLTPHLVIEGMTLASPKLFDSVAYFFAQPWWNRIWTVQEYVLNSQVNFQCGNHVLPDRVLINFVENINAHARTCCADGHTLDQKGSKSRKSIFSGTNGLQYLVNRRAKGHADLVDLMAVFRTRQAKDERDRVYGVLGLTYEHYSRELSIDYLLSVEEIYTQATIAQISLTKNLDILSHVFYDRESKTPSFVPNWAMPLPSDLPRSIYIQRVRSLHLYNASRGRGAEIQEIIRDLSLVTKCLVFDTIVTLTPLRLKSEERMDMLLSMRDIASHGTSIDGPYCGILKQTVKEALDRTFVGDSITALGVDKMRRAQTEDLANIRKCQSFFVDKKRRLKRKDEVLQGLYQQLRATVSERNFIRTSKGYFGWAPKCATVGDLIAILPGGQVPYVLKVKGDTMVGSNSLRRYIFLGDSYIHGIMDGEAIDIAEQEGRCLENVILE